ncbi:MAG: cupin domain-containing protein [Sporichthyaceae bacterium]
MPKLRAVVPLAAAAALVAAATPIVVAPQAGARSDGLGPVGMSAEFVTAGIQFGDFTYPLAEGKKITVSRHILGPGQILRWEGPGSTIALNQDGPLAHFPSCTKGATTQQRWRAFPAYYYLRTADTKTLTGMTVNTGNEPVELISLTSEALGVPQTAAQLHRHAPDASSEGEAATLGEVVDPVLPAKSCPRGSGAQTSVIASGISTVDKGFDLIDHEQIALYRYTLPAGYNSGWHFLPDETFVIAISGQATRFTGCNESTVQKPGSAYLHDAAGAPQLITNPGADSAEYLAVVLDIPNGFPVDVPTALPAPPPMQCLDSPLTY